MIHALVQGELAADPKQRTSAAGKAFITAQMKTTAGDESLLIGLAAFGSTGDKLGALKKGDALAVTGALKPNVWTDREGQERRGWNLTATAVLTLYEVGKRKKAVQRTAGEAQEEFVDDPL